MNIAKRTISATEAVRLVLTPERAFEEVYVPREVLNENRMIHSALGADNVEEIELELANGWRIKGIPDAVFEDRVVEVKVQRPLSKRDQLLLEAAYQGLIYASALKKPIVEVWLFVYATEEVNNFEFSVEDLRPDQFFLALMANLDRIAGLKRFQPPRLDSIPQAGNKLALREIKWRAT